MTVTWKWYSRFLRSVKEPEPAPPAQPAATEHRNVPRAPPPTSRYRNQLTLAHTRAEAAQLVTVWLMLVDVSVCESCCLVSVSFYRRIWALTFTEIGTKHGHLNLRRARQLTAKMATEQELGSLKRRPFKLQGWIKNLSLSFLALNQSHLFCLFPHPAFCCGVFFFRCALVMWRERSSQRAGWGKGGVSSSYRNTQISSSRLILCFSYILILGKK